MLLFVGGLMALLFGALTRTNWFDTRDERSNQAYRNVARRASKVGIALTLLGGVLLIVPT
jgi:hypothetical protein